MRKLRSLKLEYMFSSEIRAIDNGVAGGGEFFGSCCTSSENISLGNFALSIKKEVVRDRTWIEKERERTNCI